MMFTKNELLILEVILNDDSIMELGKKTLQYIRDNVDKFGEVRVNYFEHYDTLDNFTYLLFEKVYDSLHENNEVEFTEVDTFLLHVLLSQLEIEDLPLMMITKSMDKELPLQQMIDIDFIIQNESLELIFDSIKLKVKWSSEIEMIDS